MKQLSYFAVAVFGMLILGSCSTSNNVVGGGILQKRKYTGGVYWDRSQKIKASGEEEFDIYTIEEESQKKYVSSTTILNEDKAVDYTDASANTTAVEEDQVIAFEETSDEKTTVNSASAEVQSEEEYSGAQTISQKRSSLISKKNSAAPAAGAETILLVILALIIPPLAVFLFEGASGRFWIDLILALLGWGVGFWLLGGLGWVCGLVAVIYALLIVLGVI